jgi:hypothetical protein
VVKGLEIFREHFRDFADRYVLIGGAACDIAMTEAGLAFRATKYLDIVLYVEALDAAFVQAFWEFVRAGGYEIQEKSTGEKQFYRFQKPTNPDYPFMLELFSRQPDVLKVPEGSHLTPPLDFTDPLPVDLRGITILLVASNYAALAADALPHIEVEAILLARAGDLAGIRDAESAGKSSVRPIPSISGVSANASAQKPASPSVALCNRGSCINRS